jgi:hypothetical protein
MRHDVKLMAFISPSLPLILFVLFYLSSCWSVFELWTLKLVISNSNVEELWVATQNHPSIPRSSTSLSGCLLLIQHLLMQEIATRMWTQFDGIIIGGSANVTCHSSHAQWTWIIPQRVPWPCCAFSCGTLTYQFLLIFTSHLVLSRLLPKPNLWNTKILHSRLLQKLMRSIVMALLCLHHKMHPKLVSFE